MIRSPIWSPRSNLVTVEIRSPIWSPGAIWSPIRSPEHLVVDLVVVDAVTFTYCFHELRKMSLDHVLKYLFFCTNIIVQGEVGALKEHPQFLKEAII